MKKIIVSSLILLLLLSSASVARARWWGSEVKPTVKAGRQELKEERDEIREEIRVSTPPGQLKLRIWERLREHFPFLLPAGVNRATISSIAGTTLPTAIKVNKDGKTITLNITEKTVILRKFGGKSSLAELHVGDIVTARGTWEDKETAILDTRVLRDISIQKRFGTFWGKIKSISGQTFVLETSQRGEQTVTLAGSTKIVDRKEKTISFSDLKIEHRVRVTGLWDSTLKTISEVKTIKDWSIGPVVSPTPI